VRRQEEAQIRSRRIVVAGPRCTFLGSGAHVRQTGPLRSDNDDNDDDDYNHRTSNHVYMVA
jgi:hypothetical protein